MNNVILTTFTDPMMGLSYETEPVYRKLETHFPDRIEFHYSMGGLVRDIADFMIPQERALPPAEGVPRYVARLADIYRSEEPLGDVPMDLSHFSLFDEGHRSSYPLDIAFKAVERIAPGKAEQFLYRLRFAIIAEGRPATQENVLADIAERVGLDRESFLKAYRDPASKEAFCSDLETAASLGLRALPSYMLQYNDNALLLRGLAGYDDFVAAIGQLTNGTLQPVSPSKGSSKAAGTEAGKESKTSEFPKNTGKSLYILKKLLERHPLISFAELKSALGLPSNDAVLSLAQPLLDAGSARLFSVGRGHFLEAI